jgi:hypothetical protein
MQATTLTARCVQFTEITMSMSRGGLDLIMCKSHVGGRIVVQQEVHRHFPILPPRSASVTTRYFPRMPPWCESNSDNEMAMVW